jgi:hypothetical protein
VDDDEFKAQFFVAQNPLPIRFQSASNPLRITYGSGLGKANYLWKRIRKSKLHTEADYLIRKRIESIMKAIPVILCLAKIRGYYFEGFLCLGGLILECIWSSERTAYSSSNSERLPVHRMSTIQRSRRDGVGEKDGVDIMCVICVSVLCGLNSNVS